MDYTQYKVEELAADESFVRWARGDDPDAIRFWEAFRSKHPEMAVRIQQARTLVLNLRSVQETRYSDDYINTLWERIEERTGGQPKENSVSWWPYAVAASLLLMGLTALFYYTELPLSVSQEIATIGHRGDDGMVEEVNASDMTRRVYLSDGSTVLLEPDSRLRYRRGFLEGESREVFLTGTAFFEVARNPAQPFLVNTDDVVTRVLGTSFRIVAPENGSEVVVAVKTGKVSVYSRKGDPAQTSSTNAVVLLPNQQVTYLRDEEVFGKSLVPAPEIVKPAISEKDFNFENTPIPAVFQILEEAYGVDIIFDEEVMANCFVTAPLGSESLFEKLRIICRAIGARYETIDATVVITSAGC